MLSLLVSRAATARSGSFVRGRWSAWHSARSRRGDPGDGSHQADPRRGEPLIGRLLLVDALAMRFRELKLRKNPDCPVCGTHPTITKLIDYNQFCGIRGEEKPVETTDAQHHRRKN